MAKVQRDLTRRARGKYKIRVVRVRYTLRELQRTQERIDWDALTTESIDVQSTGIGDNEVHVDAYSAQPDAKAVIEQRDGKAVRRRSTRRPSTARSAQPRRRQGDRDRGHGRLGDRDAIVVHETPTTVSDVLRKSTDAAK